MPDPIVTAAAEKLTRGVPWTLIDLISYFLGGLTLVMVVTLSIAGGPGVLAFTDGHTAMTVVVAGILAYPAGFTAYSVGRSLREAFVSLRPPPKDDPEKDLHEARADQAMRDLWRGNPLQDHFSAAISSAATVEGLAERHCRQHAQDLARQGALFHYGITLVGMAGLTVLSGLVGAILRWQDVVPGDPGPWLAAAGVAAVLVLVYEVRLRDQDRMLDREYVELSVAATYYLIRELESRGAQAANKHSSQATPAGGTNTHSLS